jgi:hypothetical protein
MLLFDAAKNWSKLNTFEKQKHCSGTSDDHACPFRPRNVADTNLCGFGAAGRMHNNQIGSD